MSTALVQLSNKLAAKFGMEDSDGVMQTLKATAFKGPVSDAQMTALLIVANQYGLNPWTKEIYAFPDKNNGIVPVVGVDGWARIINEHPQFDGMDFKQDAESCTCIIYRKDRSRPVSVTEYMEECKRGTGPWQSHPRRMLRHKATIQCSRLAFGFAGIFDQDEAERIIDVTPSPNTPHAVAEQARQKPAEDSEERQAIILSLEAVANEGDMTKLQQAWDAIGKAGRQMVGAADWARIKDMAEFSANQEPAAEEAQP